MPEHEPQQGQQERPAYETETVRRLGRAARRTHDPAYRDAWCCAPGERDVPLKDELSDTALHEDYTAETRTTLQEYWDRMQEDGHHFVLVAAQKTNPGCVRLMDLFYADDGRSEPERVDRFDDIPPCDRETLGDEFLSPLTEE